MTTVCNSQIDWSEILDQPQCYDNIEEWIGPHERTICADDFNEIGCSDCCYKIVYNDRWNYNDDRDSEDYELYILGIFYEGDDCDNCDKNLILDVFYKDLMYEKAANESNFIDRITGNGIQGFNMFYYTPAKCLDIYSSICNSQEVCCIYAYDWFFQKDENNEIYLANIGGDTFYDGSYSCNPPENCNIHCDYPYESLFYYLDPTCDIPCNFGDWTDDQEMNFPYTICGQSCNIAVTYSYRTAQCNGVVYHDYKIVEYDPSGCSNCFEDEYLQAAINELIENGFFTVNLGVGGTIPLLRIMTAQCWKYNMTVRENCEDTYCCIRRYSVFRETLSDIDVTYLGGYQGDIDCEEPGCWTLCDTYPYKIGNYGNIEDGNINKAITCEIVPNPSKNELVIYFESQDRGKHQIEIYDVNSKLIFKTSLNKTNDKESLSIFLNNFHNGTYFAIIKKHGNLLFKKKFIVSK